jgi:tripeptide aminopeptidase
MDKILLKNLLTVQSESYNSFRMFSFIVRFLKNNKIDFYIYDGNIYATKGNGDNGFPCIVSHTDTVHEIASNCEILEISGNLIAFNSETMEQIGTGGDDKIGIFICLEMLLNTENIKAVFFRDEEIGCAGSYAAYVPFFTDVNFVLQFDRKGNTDFVTNAAGTELSSKQFQQDIKEIVKNRGYNFFKYGGLTDVVALKEIGVNVCMANISCGYYEPHTASEWVSIKDVSNALNLCSEIVALIGGNYYSHKEVKKVSQTYYLNKYMNKPKKIDPFEDGYNNTWDKVKQCESCLNEGEKLEYATTTGQFLCADCMEWVQRY